MRRRILAAVVTILCALVLSAGPAPAFAADPNASCLGIGGSTETALGGPGARADISEFIIDLAAENGTTPGAEYGVFAHEHLGSVDACFG
jgi:hypothetical protein